MKKSSLLFNKCKVYCFLPEDYWRKQLLVTLMIILILRCLAWLIG